MASNFGMEDGKYDTIRWGRERVGERGERGREGVAVQRSRRKNISRFTAPASLGLRRTKKVSARRLNQSVSALNSELPQIEL